ncbi:uncharacterized protein [Aegilops tauschii subsp. strangulata]|uniref:uncharacterized protein n=1 Tax=Aegilops tauschii subsp. strangulata TaxID=200361 RepID=UPI003CC8CC4A
MALKDGARSWLSNLPAGSISSWGKMRERFVANFQGTGDRPPGAGDLRRIKQQPGETLQKYIQRFKNVHLKIPKVTDEAIISAFSDGSRDVKMMEELAIHEELCMALEMFNMEDKKAKIKDVKCKEAAMLAAEPEKKCGRDHPESSKANRSFCAFHNVHSYNTRDCQELRAIRDGCFGRSPERGEQGYGRG